MKCLWNVVKEWSTNRATEEQLYLVEQLFVLKKFNLEKPSNYALVTQVSLCKRIHYKDTKSKCKISFISSSNTSH